MEARQAPARPSRGFAQETMSEDGQSWVCEELGNMLVGLHHATPRAQVVTTQLLGYNGGLVDAANGSCRCDQLDLSLGFEATPKGAPESAKLHGTARVRMDTEDRCDRVKVDVEITDPDAVAAALPAQAAAAAAAGAGAPPPLDAAAQHRQQQQQRDRERLLRDVKFAVQSLDSAIMERLNEFLWDMETINSADRRQRLLQQRQQQQQREAELAGRGAASGGEPGAAPCFVPGCMPQAA